ncbi:MAG: hypothetical protein GXP42_02920 [Chloroflexi bacterium]|nr:hypothetical protein [Chloroflexota bacterium]
MKTRLDGVETRLDGVETELSEVKTRLDGVQTRLDGVEREVRYLRRDVGELKGDSYEREIRDKASAVFGYVVRRGRDIHRYLNERLHQAVDEGRLTVAEHRQIMASDLIWEGRPRGSEGTVILVVEASWLAEKNDVERALLRAELLRRLGFQALPVVGGKVWDKQAEALAKEQGVVRVHDLNLDDESWNEALNRLKKDLTS